MTYRHVDNLVATHIPFVVKMMPRLPACDAGTKERDDT
jgi:hypothetical protein